MKKIGDPHKGGTARAAALSKTARSQSASRAANARWEMERAAARPSQEEVLRDIERMAFSAVQVLDLLENNPAQAMGPAVDLGGKIGAAMVPEDPRRGAATGALVAMGIVSFRLFQAAQKRPLLPG